MLKLNAMCLEKFLVCFQEGESLYSSLSLKYALV
jgi:hypothetical protein